MEDAHNIIHSSNLGAIVGGAVGGLVAIAMIAIAILCVRRNRGPGMRTRGISELDPEPEPVFNSGSVQEGNSRLVLQAPTVSRPTVSNRFQVDHIPNLIPGPQVSDIHKFRYSHRLSEHAPRLGFALPADHTASISQNNKLAANTKPPVIRAPPPPNSPFARTAGTTFASQHHRLAVGEELPVTPTTPLTSSWSTSNASNNYTVPVRQISHEPIVSDTDTQNSVLATAQLTDEQLDIVTTLPSTGLNPTEIARIVDRMRAGSASGVMGGEVDGMGTGIAPPGYYAIDG